MSAGGTYASVCAVTRCFGFLAMREVPTPTLDCVARDGRTRLLSCILVSWCQPRKAVRRLAVRSSASRVTDFLRWAARACRMSEASLMSGFDLARQYRSCFRLGRCCRLYMQAKQLPAMVRRITAIVGSSADIQELVHQGLYVAQVTSNLCSMDWFVCVASRSLICLLYTSPSPRD